MTEFVFVAFPSHLGTDEMPSIVWMGCRWRRRTCCAECACDVSQAAQTAVLQSFFLWTVVVSLFSLYALLVFRQLELKFHTRRVLLCQLSD